ncbi:MAG: GrdX family protein [Halanaerobium sp.]
MTDKLIVSNNPLLKEKLEDYEKIFVNTVSEVYKTSRDLIHQNWILLTHPQAGSIKPAQNPYRSIVLASSAELDFYSLKTIENAILNFEQFSQHHKKREYSPEIKKDYQLIDLSLLNSALKNKTTRKE